MREFKKGEKLYFRGCSRQYQIDNVFVPKFTKKTEFILFNEDEESDDFGEAYDYSSYVYSENESSWYPEETLTKTLNEV